MGTIGFDIEFFVADNKTKKVVPICEKLGGTKKEHRILEVTREQSREFGLRYTERGGAKYEVHEDNVSLEVNSPVFTKEEDMLGWLQYLPCSLNEVLAINKLDFHITKPEFHIGTKFPKEMLQEAGIKALEIGCDPDFDAYAQSPMAPRIVPQEDFREGVRYVGGHVHLGYSTCEQIPAFYVAHMLDLIKIAYASRDNLRAKVYGHGIFRPKPYGIEYRALGTGQLLNNAGFVRHALQMATYLETQPQLLADLYSEFDFPKIAELFRNNEKKEEITTEAMRFIEELPWELPTGDLSYPTNLWGRGDSWWKGDIYPNEIEKKARKVKPLKDGDVEIVDTPILVEGLQMVRPFAPEEWEDAPEMEE